MHLCGLWFPSQGKNEGDIARRVTFQNRFEHPGWNQSYLHHMDRGQFEKSSSCGEIRGTFAIFQA